MVILAYFDSVLARIEKFSNLPVINFFLQLSKHKTSYLCGVFGVTKCERKHANQQFNTYLLICKQTRKIYEHSQALTLGLWVQWPGGPVDLKSYWPPKKLTGPPKNLLAPCATKKYLRKPTICT